MGLYPNLFQAKEKCHFYLRVPLSLFIKCKIKFLASSDVGQFAKEN